MRVKAIAVVLFRRCVLVFALLAAAGSLRAAPERQVGPSSRRTPLTITEIHYHPASWSGAGNLEFVELRNTEPVAYDLSGTRLRGDAHYTFPTGAVLPGLSVVVIAADPSLLAGTYGVSNVFGPWTGVLPNGGGTVRLENRWGAHLLEVEYGDDPPWPVAADGAGHSLVLSAPDVGESSPLAWSASSSFGGSPGTVDPERPAAYGQVLINELLSHTNPAQAFVEVYNADTQAIDLAGFALCDEPDGACHVFPPGSLLPPGGALTRGPLELGFAPNVDGDDLFLLAPDHLTVLDAIRLGAQSPGASVGRFPDGTAEWIPLTAPTPGVANTNSRPAVGPVVINEIMYRPIEYPEQGEYVELLNISTAVVNLSGWQFTDGINFTFPPATTLPPGAFLVIARDAPFLIARHLHLNTANTLGNFGGALSDRGERLVLSRPRHAGVTNGALVVADVVTYGDGEDWGAWTDGGGSSLELTDPRADNRLAANWAGSDETRKSHWTVIETTGQLRNGAGTTEDLDVLLMQAGEALVDDIALVRAGETVNRVAPSDFESGLDGWTPLGNHLRSKREAGEGATGSASLRLRASGPGRTTTSEYPNGTFDRVWKSITNPPVPGDTFTIRAQGRWLAGWPYLVVSVKGFWLEAAGRLRVPANLGTPGLVNSRFATNAPPAVWGLSHSPLLPAAGEPIAVYGHADDPDGVAALELRYRLDPSLVYTTVAMQPEAPGGTGRYRGLIPGQPAGQLVAFHVAVRDGALPPRERTYPAADASRDALVRVGDAQPDSVFVRHHYWVSNANRVALASRSNQSNEPVDATLLYNGVRVIYNAQLRYRGNFRRFTNLTDAAYAIVYPAGERLLGDRESKLDIPSIQFPNGTRMQERHSYGMTEDIGNAASYLRFTRVHVNGSDLFRHDLQGPTRDFATSWYGDDDPHIFKEEKPLDPFAVYTNAAGEKTRATYSFVMQKNRTAVPDYDYNALYRFVDALNHPDPAIRAARVAALADPRGLAGYFAGNHVCGNVDSYGYEPGFLHNLYGYFPPTGRARLHLYDMDSAFTASAPGGVADFFPSAEAPGIQRLFRDAGFERAYWRVLQDYAFGPMQAARSSARLDAWYAAFTNDGLPFLSADVVDPNTGKTMRQWIADRRAQVVSLLNATNAAVAFSISSNGGVDFSTTNRLVTLHGLAPMAAETLWVNGLKARPAWVAPLSWELRLGLTAGSNVFALDARDRFGVVLGADALTVNFTGQGVSPAGQVIISEIMDAPAAPSGEYVELYNRSAHEAFELGGWSLEGVEHGFAHGVVIEPGGRLVVAEDAPAYMAAYGNAEVLAGDYAGKLANDGERLRLLAPGPGGGEIVVNDVLYSPMPPWPADDGSGAALQVIDVRMDNRVPGNWRRVTTPRPWTFVSVTGVSTNSIRPGNTAELRLFLGGTGAVLVDRVALVTGVVAEAGVNLISNGDFETALSGSWTAGGNHARSARDSHLAHSGAASLRVEATDHSAGGTDAVRQAGLGVVVSRPYTLSFWCRPTPDVESLTVELTLSDLRHTIALAPPSPPAAPATPGAVNALATALPEWPAVWINEVLPLNPGPVVDNLGEAEPWIELWNASTAGVSLAGLHLGRSPGAPAEWALPAGDPLAAGAPLLIWADGETNETVGGALHAGFRLDAPAGMLVLSYVSGATTVVLDSVAWDDLAPGISLGVIADGEPLSRTFFANPTPGAANTESAAPLLPLRINEWMADNSRIPDPTDGGFPDWFELYNPNPFAMSIAGYRLTDTLSSLNRFVVPAGMVIPARGFLLVWADEELVQTQPPDVLHVNFKLSNGGELIRLATPDGSVADLVTFGEQDKNRSEGRWPDGAEAIVRMTPSTPGAPNQVLQVRETAVVNGGAFRVEWGANAGVPYAIEFSDALTTTNWWPLGLVTASTSEAYFDDFTAAGVTQRSYRVREP